MKDIDRLIEGLTILKRYTGDIPCSVVPVGDCIVVYLDSNTVLDGDDYSKLKHMGWWPEDKVSQDSWMWM